MHIYGPGVVLGDFGLEGSWGILAWSDLWGFGPGVILGDLGLE